MAEKFDGLVKEIIYLSPTAKAIRYKLDKKFEFIPGQFVMIEFNIKEKNGFKMKKDKEKIQKRAFSISSSPNSDYLEITVKKTQEPLVSEYLVDYLEINEKNTFQGPYGVFTLNEDKKEIIMLAAGSGIAPFMSFLRYLNETRKNIVSTLIYSNKSESEILWKEELQDFNKYNNMNIIFTLTQEDNFSWNGLKGRVSKDFLSNLIKDKFLSEIEFYICGPRAFVSDTRSYLLDLGINRESIKIEVYE